MIRKLRRKIFWSIELSSMGVLFMILIIINIFNMIRYDHDEWKMMAAALKMRDDAFSKGHGHGKNSDIFRALVNEDLFIIDVDSEGNLLTFSGSPDGGREDYLSLLPEIISRGQREGKLGACKFLYEKKTTGGTIILSGNHLVHPGAVTAILLSLASLVISGVFFALLAGRLSMSIVRPVEKALEDQKRFIADASHEMKTPVTVINANLSILGKEMPGNQWIDYIRDASDRLSGLVQSMLEYARIDYLCSTDAHGDVPVSFDAADAITEATLPFESVAFESGFSFEYHIPPQIRFTGNDGDLKQIVGILLDNALQYCSPGGAVCLRASETVRRRKLKEERLLCVSVSNTGEDIPEDRIPLLFHRFYRGDPSRAEGGHGFGLGLSIACTLVQKNGGQISATSKDYLTTFTFVLPNMPDPGCRSDSKLFMDFSLKP